MAEEQKITYDEWENTYDELKTAEENLQQLNAQYTPLKNSIGLISKSLKDEDRGDLETLVKQADTLKATDELVRVGAAKTAEKLQSLSSPQNLESILSTVDSRILKESIGSPLYYPQNLEKVPTEYKKAAELHAQIGGINRIGLALNQENINRKTVKGILPAVGEIIKEYYTEQYPDKEDKYNPVIREALIKLVASNDENLIRKFEKIVPRVIKNKEEAFYKEIGGEKNLTKYLTHILTDEKEIRTYYTLLAQIKGQKKAEKAHAGNQREFVRAEPAYTLAA